MFFILKFMVVHVPFDCKYLIENMCHLTTTMSILIKKVHFWSCLTKCQIDQVVKKVILIK
jgi:hypothetical protein